MVRTAHLNNYSDVHYTEEQVAFDIIQHFNPSGVCLEPFRGAGAFTKWLPPDTAWCEIQEGRNFFDFDTPVDWIVTNPPFSNLTQVMEHAFKLADNCVFLIPISKYWSSAPRLAAVKNYGGVAEIHHMGTGRSIGFDIGFPFAAMHFKRGYQGAIRESWRQ